MKQANDLIGTKLSSFTLSAGARSFELARYGARGCVTYSLSTMFEISLNEEDVFKCDISESAAFQKIWRYFDSPLQKVELSSDSRVCTFKFAQGSLYIWSKEIDHDNLVIVKSHNSDDWIAIG